jgi:hypothetical protein
MGDLPDDIERLTTRLEMLERRVYTLEHPSDAPGTFPVPGSSSAQAPQASATRPHSLAGGMFPVLGRAMLGMAGAYLLRAVAESSSLPKLEVAALAFAYAIMWLVWAARVPAGEWFASTTYACTSALILAPMLWELTLRFKVLPAAATAAALAAFVCAASALAWKRNLTPVFWVSNVTAVAVALTLSIATHQMIPFIGALLLMALIGEYAACRNRELRVRTLVALAADLGVWALIYIYSSPQSARLDYPIAGNAALLAPALALFLVYGVSVTFRTAVNKKTITVFEAVQTMIAFLLAASSLVCFGPHGGAIVLGASCLALSAATYAIAFVLFSRVMDRRNFLVFSTWSAALYLAGCWLCLPPLWMALCLGMGAIVATVLGARRSRTVLELHGLAFLLAAATVSGLLRYILEALAGTLPGRLDWGVPFVSACAALCYAAGIFSREASWKQQLLQLVFASLAVGAGAALLVQGMMWLAALRVSLGLHHLAFIRTLTICAAALALAFSGSEWRHKELTRIGYAALAVVAVKLLFEDLRLGHLEFIAASIFLFAVTLIAVPRVARMGHRQ